MSTPGNQCNAVYRFRRCMVPGALLTIAALVQSAQAEPPESVASPVPWSPTAAESQPGIWSDMRPTWNLQAGVDSWDLHPSEAKDNSQNQNGNSRLFLANSNTAWPYQNQAPWLTFQGTLRPLPDTVLAIKFHSDQALGSTLSEFSLDQAWHAFGVRMGVLDYKTTWCRTYDVDSPWVRENDPVCSVQNVGVYLRAAPGAQVYSNFVLGDFKLQALAGVYSPLWGNYDTREFTNASLNNRSAVTKNEKTSASINAIHLSTGTEFRLGLLHTDQTAEVQILSWQPGYRVSQQVNVTYAGVSFNPGPAWNLRLTRTETTAENTGSYPDGYTRLDSTVPSVFSRDSIPNNASVLELNYQASARDVFSFAYSVNDLGKQSNTYLMRLPSMAIYSTQDVENFDARTTNMSISWRRDWNAHFFTVLQYSDAQLQSARSFRAGDPQNQVKSNGYAIGLRLGYRL